MQPPSPFYSTPLTDAMFTTSLPQLPQIILYTNYHLRLPTNHGYPSIVPEVFYTPNWASKAPSPTHTSKLFRLFVANLRWLSKNRNYHDGTNKFPSFLEPPSCPSSLDLWVNEWLVLYHITTTVDQIITITDNRD